MRMKSPTEPGSSRRRCCGRTPNLKTTGAKRTIGSELNRSGWRKRRSRWARRRNGRRSKKSGWGPRTNARSLKKSG
jgi:hypothetical protein